MWVGWSPAAHATSPERPWTSLAHPPAFEHVSVEQGLSQSSVHTIAQDKLGFLWMGTDPGLNRYDGFRFQTFHPDKSRAVPRGRLHRTNRAGPPWLSVDRGAQRRADPSRSREPGHGPDPDFQPAWRPTRAHHQRDSSRPRRHTVDWHRIRRAIPCGQRTGRRPPCLDSRGSPFPMTERARPSGSPRSFSIRLARFGSPHRSGAWAVSRPTVTPRR